MAWFGSLTNTQKAVMGGVAFCLALFFGFLLGRAFLTPSLEWEGVAAIIALIALMFAIFGYFDNRRSQQLEHRAYLRPTMVWVREEQHMLHIDVEISNYGRTPARDVTVHAHVVPFGSDVQVSGHAHYLAIRDIHPGPVRTVTLEIRSLGPAFLEKVTNGEAAMSITAKVTYSDVFTNRQSDTDSANYRRTTVHIVGQRGILSYTRVPEGAGLG